MAVSNDITHALPLGTYLQHGKYRVEKVLGQGSFGITYLASVNLTGALGMIPTNTFVAVKEFFMKDVNGRDEGPVTAGSKNGVFYNYKRRFIKEAQTLSHLNHSNIVRVLDLFEENNTAYYVMEYLDGGSLDSLIASKKKLTVEESKIIIRQVASALEYMHSNRMLHLDMKPANIMLRHDGKAVLIDFGLTKEFDENGFPESSTTIGHGTPGYAPLEQSNYQAGNGFPVTMDVYALGGTLYKMLTGKRPPEASMILNDGMSILELDGVSDHHISSVIRKAMDPLKKNRFASVHDFMESLKPTHHSETSLFQENSISYLIVLENKAVIYYYRGTVYKDLNGGFLNGLEKVGDMKEVSRSFIRHFTKCEDLSFDDFIEQYSSVIENCKWKFSSFLKHDDFFRIISSCQKYPDFRIGYLRKENSFVAFYLSGHHKGDDSYDESGNERLHYLKYDNSNLQFTSGDDVCVIEDDKSEDKEKTSYAKGKQYLIRNSENLKIALLGGFIKSILVYESIEQASLLIDSCPFDIDFGPQWGNVIPRMLHAGTSMPRRQSDIFDFAGTDYVSIRIGSRIHKIEIASEFGYTPKDIECTLEVSTSLNCIDFKIKDCHSDRSVSYHLFDLILNTL